jgi:hypothetical protein
MDGLLYLTGGGIGYGAVESNIYPHDPVSGTWGNNLGVNPLATSRADAPMIALNHKLHMIGGSYSDAAYNTHLTWDPVNHWVQKANTPFAYRGGCAVVSNGTLYHIGGCPTSLNAVDEVWRYDEPSDTWTLDSHLLYAVMWAAAAVDSLGNIYVFGGTASASSAAVAYTQMYPIGIPTAPVATAATSPTSSGFTANWGTSSGATGYRLDVSTDSGFGSFVSGYNNLDVGNVLTYPVTALSPGVTYHYRVRGYNTYGTSGSSNVVSQAIVLAAPLATAATDVTTVDFVATWEVDVSPEGFLLDVSIDDAFTDFLPGYDNLDVGDVLNCLIAPLASDTTYYYRVKAYSATSVSADSNVISQATLPAPIMDMIDYRVDFETEISARSMVISSSEEISISSIKRLDTWSGEWVEFTTESRIGGDQINLPFYLTGAVQIDLRDAFVGSGIILEGKNLDKITSLKLI